MPLATQVTPRSRSARLAAVAAALGITVAGALTTAPAQAAAPLAPANLTATYKLNPFEPAAAPMIVLRWSAPERGDRPTFYRVYIGSRLLETTRLTRARITPLVTGQTYVFRVTAVNGDGESGAASITAVAQVEPTEPLNVQVVPDDGALDISWDAPQDNGGTAIASYRVVVSPRGPQPCAPTGATSCRIEGLRNGRQYEATVQARNAAWPSLQGVESVPAVGIPGARPSGPRNVRVLSGGSTSVTLAWDVPANPGPDPIAGYTIKLFDYSGPRTPDYPQVTVGSLARRVVLNGLTPGATYDFGVQAYTAAGPGAMTVNATHSPIGLPAAPGRVEVVGLGDASAKIEWQEPDPNGGSDPSAYRVVARPVAGGRAVVAECTTKIPYEECSTDLIVKGLRNGVRYSFTVAARNTFGWGPASTFPAFGTPQRSAP